MSSKTEGAVDSTSLETRDRDAIPCENWRADERRAELLQRIEGAGHPRELNQTELADEFGVSQQQISKDFKKIGADIRDSLDVDRRALTVNSTVQKSIKGLLKQNQFYKAGKLALEWDQWVQATATESEDTQDKSVCEILSE
jgi:predicted naringenin-chalcone synthase